MRYHIKDKPFANIRVQDFMQFFDDTYVVSCINASTRVRNLQLIVTGICDIFALV